MSEQDELDVNDIMLSDAEREAIGWDDEGNVPEVVDEQTTVEPAEAEAETPEAAEAEPDPDPAPEVKSAVESDPETDQRKPMDTLRPEDIAFAPQYEAQVVENLQQIVRDLDARYEQATDELAAKYEGGELTFSEYRKAERQLNNVYDDQRSQLREAQLKADIANEHSRQSAAQKWQMEQTLFFSDNPDYKSDPILRGALGAQLESLYAVEENAGKSGLWFLREAAKAIDSKFNRVTEKPETKQKLKEAEDTVAKRKAMQAELPKTLGAVPAAAENADEAGEFAYLDKLGGMELEQAISKLSDAQLERWHKAA